MVLNLEEKGHLGSGFFSQLILGVYNRQVHGASLHISWCKWWLHETWTFGLRHMYIDLEGRSDFSVTPRTPTRRSIHRFPCDLVSRNGRCSKAKVVSLSNRSKPGWNLKLSKEIPDRLALKWVFRCTNDTSIRIPNIPWSKAPSGPSTYQDFSPPKKKTSQSITGSNLLLSWKPHANSCIKFSGEKSTSSTSSRDYAKCLIKKTSSHPRRPCQNRLVWDMMLNNSSSDKK